jgi:hypothetical protein
MRRVCAALNISADTSVLDVGGTRYIWTLAPVRPRAVLLNLRPVGHADDWFTDVIGDARRLPFKDDAFDLVFSNSLVDHLATLDQQRRFADEVRRVARCYAVQSPNHRFPVEPHLLTPFVHWLPKRVRVALMRNFTVRGLVTRPTRQECEAFADEVRMLTPKDMRTLFPEAEIWHERFMGMTKSLTAVKR